MGLRLKNARSKLGLSQLAAADVLGINRGTLAAWEKGDQPANASALAVLAGHGLDVQYVITGRRGRVSSRGDEETIFVPLFSATGSMGPGNELLTEDVILGDVPVSRAWLGQHLPRSRPEALQLVHAYGDSMAGTLNSGDFALVDTDQRVADVDGVYVLQAGGQLFIKRVTRKMDGSHEVSSDNPNVKTVDMLNGSQQVRICGRVVYGWNGRRL